MLTVEQQIVSPNKIIFDDNTITARVSNQPSAQFISSLIRKNTFFNNQTLRTHLAAFYGKVRMLHAFLLAGLDKNAEDENGRTLVHYAAAGGNVNILKYCFDCSVSISKTDNFDKTIVHIAAEYNKVNVLKWANEMDLPLNQVSQFGTPLFIACQKCYFRVVDYLCTFEKSKISPDHVHQNMVSIMACLKNYFFEAIPLLARAGADFNVCLISKWTCLHFAVQANRLVYVEVLLEYGSDPNVIDAFGWTPLHLAAQNASSQIVLRLLEAGASPAIKTQAGVTPYQLARNRFDSDDKNRILQLLQVYIVKKYVDGMIMKNVRQIFL